ncbi:MAG: hypothetical protein KatS3mg124_2125 [Porticoccaceae bacterium]|nr:MAG: hypothetical protein KatS3mg124_2125 [Porticoccaceae bacterium]
MLLAGCATPPQTRLLEAHPPPFLGPEEQVLPVPFVAQEAYQCGPAALAMVLAQRGRQVDPASLVEEVYLPARHGSLQPELLAAVRRRQLLPLPVEPRLEALIHWVASGRPVLVLQNLGLAWYPRWHYAVVVGFDGARRELLLHSGRTPRYRISWATFERTWARAGYWGFVVLEPGERPLATDPEGYLRAAAALEKVAPEVDRVALWEAAAAVWPERPEFAFLYATALAESGHRQAAEARLRALLERHPDFLPAWNNLAHLLLARGDAAGAAALARRGLALAGGRHPVLERTLAEALAASSRPSTSGAGAPAESGSAPPAPASRTAP